MAKLEKINKTENKHFFFILKKKKTALVPQLELHTTTFRFLVFLTFRFFDVIDHHRNLLVAPAPLFYFFFSIFFSLLSPFLYLVFLPSLFFHCIPLHSGCGLYYKFTIFFLFSLVSLVSIPKYKMGLG